MNNDTLQMPLPSPDKQHRPWWQVWALGVGGLAIGLIVAGPMSGNQSPVVAAPEPAQTTSVVPLEQTPAIQTELTPKNSERSEANETGREVGQHLHRLGIELRDFLVGLGETSGLTAAIDGLTDGIRGDRTP